MNTVTVRDVVIGEGRPKIAVPVVGETKEAIIAQAASFAGVPYDVVEWRVDHFENAFDAAAIKDVMAALRDVIGEAPLLVTFRTADEGGAKAIDLEDYVELLAKIAASHNADLIDVELALMEREPDIVTAIHVAGGKIVASNHDFTATPEKDEIVRRLRKMQDLGADIAKIAVMPTCQRDVITLLAATEEMYTDYAQVPLITMSMSGKGVVSRLVGEAFGSALTFGCFGKASAPGQMDAPTLDVVLEAIHRAQ